MSKQWNIPGVAVGVWIDNQEIYALHGVTSTKNPLPIDQDTFFWVASVTKPFPSATTLMRLVAEGKDQQAAETITVLNLLNHTSGLDLRVNVDTGEGDDALTRTVVKMAEVELVARPGARSSYSQAGYDLLGRTIEKVTGQTFEQAVHSLVCEPLGISHSFFARDDFT